MHFSLPRLGMPGKRRAAFASIGVRDESREARALRSLEHIEDILAWRRLWRQRLATVALLALPVIVAALLVRQARASWV